MYVCMDNTDQYIHIHVYVQLINLLFTFTLESQLRCLVHARDLSQIIYGSVPMVEKKHNFCLF